MALFGAPLVHEDHAVRACYAALRMQESLKRYAEDTRRSHGVEVQIRVGLNSGEVVVRSVGSDLRTERKVPARSRFLTAECRRSRSRSPGRPARPTRYKEIGVRETDSVGGVPGGVAGRRSVECSYTRLLMRAIEASAPILPGRRFGRDARPHKRC